MCFLRLGDKINKRLGAMNKPTNVVHSGWMTKSPPEQKLQSPLKIFRAKWKQRYFVLHKPSGSLPDQYELSYYNSEQCAKKKGSIDLDQCEQIIESLDSDQYPYLLAIKTVCRGKVRTYYLATNSEEDMGTWVQCLCRVCGLKQEDTPTDIPDARLSVHGLSGSAMSASPPTAGNSTVRSTVTASPTITSQPLQAPPSRTNTITSSSSSSNSQPPPSTSPQSYVFLNECTTGTPESRSDRYRRADSTDSAPEYQAPPPPPDKKGTHVHNSEHAKNSLHDSVFDVYDHPPNAGHQETYDRPRSGGQELYDQPRSGEFGGSQASLDDDDVYKVPPSASGPASMFRVKRSSVSSDNTDLNAAVPLPVPRHSPRSTRSSLSDRPDSMASMGRPTTENYDVPPPRQTSTSSHEGAGGSSDAPPTPPLRPPKPHSLMPQSPYQNVPSNSKAYEGGSLSAVPAAPPKVCQVTLSYDVPRASTVVSPPRDSSGMALAPPVPRQSTHAPSGGHLYVNSVPGLSSSPAVPPLPSTYLPIKNGERGDMSDTPPAPSQCRDASYTDMSGAGGGNGGQDLYQVPPVAPRPPARAGTVPAGRLTGAATVGPVGDVEAQVIWSNMHTKSFKRKNQVNRSPLPARPPPPLEPRRPPLPVRNEFASSSEDDDDLSVDGNNTHHDLSVVRMSTVPAPPADPDPEPELKYLDLALDTPPPDPSRSQASASHGAPTEYREIDFIKTQALQDTKRARNMKK